MCCSCICLMMGIQAIPKSSFLLDYQTVAALNFQIPTHGHRYKKYIFSWGRNTNVCSVMIRTVTHKHTNKKWTHDINVFWCLHTSQKNSVHLLLTKQRKSPLWIFSIRALWINTVLQMSTYVYIYFSSSNSVVSQSNRERDSSVHVTWFGDFMYFMVGQQDMPPFLKGRRTWIDVFWIAAYSHGP